MKKNAMKLTIPPLKLKVPVADGAAPKLKPVEGVDALLAKLGGAGVCWPNPEVAG